ncbi:MAG: ArsR/SmtB family transcription factor [Rubrivivax sp.]|nr:metalloregulator ArsR/SmtB family transcription factor [Rubrivivax sp.]
MEHLPDATLGDVAAFFQALSEPTRLRVLNQLRDGEHSVGELAELAGTTTANVSRHLSLLLQRGIVLREGRGTSVYYRIADPAIYQLCDLVCGTVERQHQERVLARRPVFPG